MSYSSLVTAAQRHTPETVLSFSSLLHYVGNACSVNFETFEPEPGRIFESWISDRLEV